MKVPSGTNTFAVSLVIENVLCLNCDRACAPYVATRSSQRAVNADDKRFSVSIRSERLILFSRSSQTGPVPFFTSPEVQPLSATTRQATPTQVSRNAPFTGGKQLNIPLLEFLKAQED